LHSEETKLIDSVKEETPEEAIDTENTEDAETSKAAEGEPE